MTQILSQLVRRKPASLIAAEQSAESKAAEGDHRTQVYSLPTLILFGGASVLGCGIFVVTGEAAAKLAGPAVVLAFLIAGFVCWLTGICYSKFCSRMTSSGSAYTYIYTSLGEVFAFLASLGLAGETTLSSAALARSWTHQLRHILGREDLLLWSITGNSESVFKMDLLAPVITALITGICLVGVKESANFGSAVTVFNCLLILTVIAAGFSNFSTANLTPFFIEGNGAFIASVPGLLKAVSKVAYSFIGWDAPCTMSEEAKEPQKNVPRAIMGTLLLVGSLYAGMALSICSFAPRTKLIEVFEQDGATLANVFKTSSVTGYSVMGSVVSYGILFTTFNASLASAQGQPRVWFRMAKDGLMPRTMTKMNTRGCLTTSILWTGLISSLFATFLDVDAIFEIVTVSILTMQALVCIGSLVIEIEAADATVRGGEEYSSKSYRLGRRVFATLMAGGACAVLAGAFIQEGLQGWAYACLSLTGVAVLATLFLVQSSGSVSWTKAVIPAMATVLNFFFTGNLKFTMLWKMAVLYLVFSVVYFRYGLRHSILATATSAKAASVSAALVTI